MINNFDGEDFFFLSNFSDSPIKVEGIFQEINGKTFPSVEHAYQAAKTKDRAEIFKIMQATTSGRAKRAGAAATLREDWDSKKVFVMGLLLLSKFEQHPDLLTKLRATAPHELVEGNLWHDNFWGACSCEKCKPIFKQNMHGQLLQAIRDKDNLKFYELIKTKD